MLRTLCFLNGAALKEDGTVPKLASGGSVRILLSQALYQDRPCREAPVRARGERPGTALRLPACCLLSLELGGLSCRIDRN